MKILSIVLNTKINPTGIELRQMLFQLQCNCVTGTQAITYTNQRRQRDRQTERRPCSQAPIMQLVVCL